MLRRGIAFRGDEALVPREEPCARRDLSDDSRGRAGVQGVRIRQALRDDRAHRNHRPIGDVGPGNKRAGSTYQRVVPYPDGRCRLHRFVHVDPMRDNRSPHASEDAKASNAHPTRRVDVMATSNSAMPCDDETALLAARPGQQWPRRRDPVPLPDDRRIPELESCEIAKHIAWTDPRALAELDIFYVQKDTWGHASTVLHTPSSSSQKEVLPCRGRK